MPESQIKLLELETHREIPAAPDDSILLSSENLCWRINVELHKLSPMETPEHQIEKHRLMIHILASLFCMNGKTKESGSKSN